MSTLAIISGRQLADGDGVPYAGAKAYFYSVGTTTALSSYSDSALAIPNASPVVADANGWFDPIYVASDYRLVLRTADDTLISDWDALPSIPDAPATDRATLGMTLFPRTAAEILAGITPTYSYYQPGDVRRYGASATATASANVTAIQAALDCNTMIFVPELYPINAALNLNDGNYIVGFGKTTGFSSSHAGSVLKGKSVTPASGTNVRRYRVGGENFQIVGPGAAVAGSVALDMRGVTMSKWWNLFVTTVNLGIWNGDGYSSYYNEFHGVDISTVTTGVQNTTLGNDNKMFGGRVNQSTTGTIDNDCTGNSYFGVAIEQFTTGHSSSPTAAATNIRYVCSRLENAPTSGTGFVISSLAQVTSIIAPQFAFLTTDISDSAADTNVVCADQNFKIAGGTRVRKHFSTSVTKDIASLAAGAIRAESFTVTGVSVGDSVYCTLPSGLTDNLVVRAPQVTASNTVQLTLYNPTGTAQDPPSLSFIFDVWRH